MLDPFLGSGTTLAVARQLGLHGVGIDASREYLEIARQRIQNPHPKRELPQVVGQESFAFAEPTYQTGPRGPVFTEEGAHT